jgi:hypothetical protein
MRVRDIHYLPDVKWCDGQAETGAGAGKCGRSDAAELDWCERSPYGSLSVFSVDGAHKRSDEDAEEGQGQRMTNEVEKDEAAAESSHVTDQLRQVVFAKVMAEVHRICDIGNRKRVAYSVSLKDRDRRGDTGVRIDVHANDLHPKPATDLFEDETCTTTHIQDPVDRQRIAIYGADDVVGVTQPTVNSRKIPVCTFD